LNAQSRLGERGADRTSDHLTAISLTLIHLSASNHYFYGGLDP
jgi:hypothetical protein